MHLKKFVFSLTLVGAFSCASAQLTEIVVDNVNNPNEPSVCFSHTNDSLLYAAANIRNFYTINHKNKSVHQQIATSKLGVYGDPVVHYTNQQLYFAHLSKTEGKSYGKWFDRIVVQRIESVQPWVEHSYSVGLNDHKMQDKPWLSSDNTSGSRAGNIYVTWTEFDAYGSANPLDRSRIRFSVLRPQDTAFSTAITLSDTTGDCLDSDYTLEGANTCVDSDGTIYAVWAGHNNLYLDYSTDGGATWHEDQVIQTQVKGWDMEMPNIMRANGMPFIVADTHRNALYICWADERNGHADIWLTKSITKGQTWSKPILLNLDKTTTHQYFPNIAIDHATGSVYVAYYDFKTSPSNTFYSISLAQYDTAGYVSNTQLTPYVTALPGKKIFYGDYLDIDIHHHQLAVAYTAYDLSGKTSIKLITEKSLSDGIFGKIGINNTPAVLKNGDTAVVLLNVEHPHKTTVKIKTTKNGKTKRYRFVARYAGTQTGWDDVLGTFPLDDQTTLTTLKYRIRDRAVRHVYKRTIRYQ